MNINLEVQDLFVNSDEVKEAKKEVSKAKAKPKAKAKAEPKKVVEYEGFALSQNAKVSDVKASLSNVSKAIKAISDKEKNLLAQFLIIGEFQSQAVKLFASSKVYGQFVAKMLPESQSLDPALRSNCKWLYEAVNDPNGDLLKILGVNRIEDFKSGNPTVIRREYKKALELAKAEEEAKAMGIDFDSPEEAKEKLASLNGKDSEQAKKQEAQLIASAQEHLEKLVKCGHDMSKLFADMMLQSSRKEQAEFILSIEV